MRGYGILAQAGVRSLASGEGDAAVGMSGEVVVVVVGQGVVSGAEPRGVLDRGVAAVGPGGEVVGVTPRRGVLAPRAT